MPAQSGTALFARCMCACALHNTHHCLLRRPALHNTWHCFRALSQVWVVTLPTSKVCCKACHWPRHWLTNKHSLGAAGLQPAAVAVVSSSAASAASCSRHCKFVAFGLECGPRTRKKHQPASVAGSPRLFCSWVAFGVCLRWRWRLSSMLHVTVTL